MAVGGWSGDPVHAAAVHRRHPPLHTREIADWVSARYSGIFVGESTMYRLF
jgi:hypothetical protein